MSPKYPNIHVQLTGSNGNAFSVIGACLKAARSAKLKPAELDAFTKEAQSGDYDNLLQTCMKWFDVS